MGLALKLDPKYTYEDYLRWTDEQRREIIDGEVYDMSPAPSIKHQRISWNLIQTFGKEAEKIKPCVAFHAPTDVVFDTYNVVQPDIFVVCDKKKIGENNIQGSPDLIMEIASPYTVIKDKREKKALYERFGVKEYIIIYPELEMAERFLLQDGKYGCAEVFNWDEKMPLKTFDIELNLWEIFEKEKR